MAMRTSAKTLYLHSLFFVEYLVAFVFCFLFFTLSGVAVKLLTIYYYIGMKG